jgi:acetyl-CoA acetyltransferase
MSQPNHAFICDAIAGGVESMTRAPFAVALNEAFTAQALAAARIVTAAVNQLHRTGGRYALCTMCTGVGQGIALVLERG